MQKSTLNYPTEVIGKHPSKEINPSHYSLVFCAGVFDLIHYGHIRYLRVAKQLGDILVVGLLTDEGVARYKTHKPILNYQQRWEVLQSIRYVDYIVKQEDTDPTDTLDDLKEHHNWIFDIMVRGNDYKEKPPGTEFIQSHGGRIVRVPYCDEISSTKIKEKITEGYNG